MQQVLKDLAGVVFPKNDLSEPILTPNYSTLVFFLVRSQCWAQSRALSLGMCLNHVACKYILNRSKHLSLSFSLYTPNFSCVSSCSLMPVLLHTWALIFIVCCLSLPSSFPHSFSPTHRHFLPDSLSVPFYGACLRGSLDVPLAGRRSMLVSGENKKGGGYVPVHTFQDVHWHFLPISSPITASLPS